MFMICILAGAAPSVAFSVRLHVDTLMDDNPLVFGTVSLNIGDGYNSSTGLHKFPLYIYA